VLPHIRFGHEVLEAAWDDATRRWRIETSGGTWTADVLISANGALAEPATPPIPGLERFEGTRFHSAAWNHDTDLAGRRVAMVGTGASAVQIVPKIQPHVRSLHVFQRTPAWVLPHTDRPVTAFERKLYRRVPEAQMLARGLIYLSREMLVPGFAKDPRLVAPIRRLATSHLRRQVRDPELRRKLTPRFSPGCKRLLLSNDFYPALSASNVELVTDPIRELDEGAVVTSDGARHEVDTVVFGTGFRVTDNPVMERLRGRDGRSLAEMWHDAGLRAYLGTTVPGFPNFFLMSGPNTGIGHTSLLVMIEAQMRYVLGCLDLMRREDIGTVEVRAEACDRFNAWLDARLRRTVWNSGGCVSWYLDRHGRNGTMWPDFTWRFRSLTRRFDPGAYRLERTAAGREPEPVPA